jgi:hypothetical protein
MVKDWEPCKGHWQGTIIYTTQFKEVGSAENIHLTDSWDDETFYQAQAEIPGRKDDQGLQIARARATAHEKKVRIATGKGVCFRTTTQNRELTGSDSATTSGFSVTVNPRSGQYTVSAPTILVNATGSESVVSKVQGTCNNPFNKDVTRSSPLTGLSLDADGPIVQGRGTIDPNNPDVISGTDGTTLRTQRGGERKVTITWNLRKCQDQ